MIGPIVVSIYTSERRWKKASCSIVSYEVDDLEKRKILQGQRALPKDETEQDEEEANNKHETCETRRTMGMNMGEKWFKISFLKIDWLSIWITQVFEGFSLGMPRGEMDIIKAREQGLFFFFFFYNIWWFYKAESRGPKYAFLAVFLII